jgi:hypothetical protein
VEDGLIKPDEENIAAVERITSLDIKSRFKNFLGVTGYYANFIPGYQDKAYPLTEVLKRNKPDSGVG